MAVKIGTGVAGDGGLASLANALTFNCGMIGRVKLDTLVNYRIICYNGNSGANGWGVLKSSTGIQSLLGGVAFGPAGALANDTWAAFCFQRDISTFTLYIDGVSQGTTGSGPGTPTTQTSVAKDGAGGAGMSVADVAIYNGNLTLAQIQAHARGVIVPLLGIPNGNIDAYWPCYGIDLTQDYDMSGNGLTLAWTNAALDTTTKPNPPMGRPVFFPSYPATYVTPAPVNTSPPVVTGVPAQLETLSCTTGTWTNASSYTYQWQDSPDGSTGWADITGETSASFLINDLALEGRYLRCVVTATGSGGSASEPSNVVGPVEEFLPVTSFSVIG